jgi:plasmid replication initiation protein
MKEKSCLVSTPESLGVIPEYVLQYHAISRSIQNLSTTAKKLTAMAMSLLPLDLSVRTASFSFTEFCKALNYGDGGEQYRLFTAAVHECMGNTIVIERINRGTGKKKWEEFTWFSVANVDESTGLCTMTFSEELASVLLEFKKMYSKMNLVDFGKLQSHYGIRILEITTSYSSLAGKSGNKDGAWYFEYSVSDLRLILSVPDDAYPQTGNFRRFVIEKPIKEINEAGIGVTITTEGIKQGRNLKGIRFNCEETKRTASTSRKRRRDSKKPPLELPEPSAATANMREEKELQHLKTLYPDEFAKLYEEALTAQKFDYGDFGKRAAQATALLKLREKYGIVK